MCRLLKVSLIVIANILVSCSSKEKRSTTLDDRADEKIPYADLQVGDVPDHIEENFLQLQVKVWEFDYKNSSQSSSVGRERIINLQIPRSEARRVRARRKR